MTGMATEGALSRSLEKIQMKIKVKTASLRTGSQSTVTKALCLRSNTIAPRRIRNYKGRIQNHLLNDRATEEEADWNLSMRRHSFKGKNNRCRSSFQVLIIRTPIRICHRNWPDASRKGRSRAVLAKPPFNYCSR